MEVFFDALVGNPAGFDREGFGGGSRKLQLVESRDLVLPGEAGGIFRNAVQEKSALMKDDAALDLNLLGNGALDSWEGGGVVGSFFLGAAVVLDGAGRASRFRFLAEGGSQFHDGLIVVAGVVGVEEGLGGLLKDFNGLPVAREGLGMIAEAGEDANDVSVNNRDGVILRDGGDGGGGIGADAGEGLPFVGALGCLWEPDECLGEFVEIAGAAVVAEAFPVFKDGFGGGMGKGFEVREVLHPALEVGQHGFNLGLLQHELGNHGSIEAGFGAPGKGALGGLIPAQQVGAEALGWFG